MIKRKNVFIFLGAFLSLSGALAYGLSAPAVQADSLVSQNGWTLKYVDSEELDGEDGAAVNAFDGDINTIWHTEWYASNPPHPHEIQIDLGGVYDIDGFMYLPRQDGGSNGRIAQYEFYISTDGSNWGTPVATGTLEDDASEKKVTFSSVTGQFIRLRALSEVNGNPWTTMAEINLLSSSSTPAASGGLWGEYNLENTCYWRAREFKSLAIENMDFESFDDVLSERVERLPYDCAFVKWKGAILIDEDKAGDYNFRVDMNGYQQYYFIIDGEYVLDGYKYHYGDSSGVKTLTAGWHNIYIWTHVYSSWNSQFQVYWTPPGEDEEIIPVDHLKHEYWADNTITIPDEDKPKANVNYVAGGVGTLELIEEGINPEIEIDMPVANLEDILEDEVWITWFSRNETISGGITVTNNNATDLAKKSRDIAGTKLLTEYGLKPSYPGMMAKIPAILVDDNETGKLSFSFNGLGAGGAEDNGIGIIVPYEDADMPKGQILLKMYGASGGITPAFVFPLGEDMDKDKDIHPLFFLSDGETKFLSHFRPNYMMMLSGSGSMPNENVVLKDMPGARMIVPESNPINRSNDNTWYPNYAREGGQFDVISTNYTPNQWTGKDTVYEGNEDGKIDSISIPPTHTWIAFQYYATNFDEDGQSGSGESGPISGGGLFSTLDDSTPNYTLDVTVNGSGEVVSNPAGINCPGDCLGLYESGTIALTATPVTGSEFSGWNDDCGGTGGCSVTMNKDRKVTATFIATPAVPGACGTAIDTSSCSEPTENLCVPPESLSIAGVCPTSDGWEWVCEGSGGSADADCKTEKYCRNWKEVAP